MWSPDRASRCDAPAFLKVDTVSRGSPLRSPPRKAFSSGAVPSSRKGSVSMKSLNASPALSVSACPGIDAHPSDCNAKAKNPARRKNAGMALVRRAIGKKAIATAPRVAAA